MRKFKRFRPRSLLFRLLVIVAGALLLAGAFVPTAHAQSVIAYWNFDDGAGENLPVNMLSDAPGPIGILLVPSIGINPYTFPEMRSSAPGLNVGLAPGDPGPSVLGMGLSRSGMHSPACFEFSLPNPGIFQDMTMSFAIDRVGNGFALAQLFYSIDGGVNFIAFTPLTILPEGATTLVSGVVPAAANNQPLLAFRLCVTGGQSNGINVQNTIDNILIVGTIVPEPATIVGGLLGVLGLGWQQRRRLIGALRFRKT